MTVGRCLLLLGFVFLTMMVFTHVAEGLHLFPGMGWGLPDSPGHYLDFVSAVLGCGLLIAGMISGRLVCRGNKRKGGGLG
jgi:hypothetical protein